MILSLRSLEYSSSSPVNVPVIHPYSAKNEPSWSESLDIYLWMHKGSEMTFCHHYHHIITPNKGSRSGLVKFSLPLMMLQTSLLVLHFPELFIKLKLGSVHRETMQSKASFAAHSILWPRLQLNTSQTILIFLSVWTLIPYACPILGGGDQVSRHLEKISKVRAIYVNLYKG